MFLSKLLGFEFSDTQKDLDQFDTLEDALKAGEAMQEARVKFLNGKVKDYEHRLHQRAKGAKEAVAAISKQSNKNAQDMLKDIVKDLDDDKKDKDDDADTSDKDDKK